jgi:hypothetical protein
LSNRVFIGQERGGARHAQHMLDPAADIGMMIARRGRQRLQLFAVGGEDVDHQVAQRHVGDSIPNERREFVEHLGRIELRSLLTREGIEAVGSIAIDGFADFFDVELRAEVRVAVDCPQLVKNARPPALAAFDCPGAVAPNRKAHFAGMVAKRDFEIRLAVARGQLFLADQQREQIGLLAVDQLGEGDDGDGFAGWRCFFR